jgi:sigma-E factor negative regulatory protein RseA
MKEILSVWMDDELSREQADALLPQIKRDGQLRRDWDCYHLIGDALRGVEGADIGAKLRARLDAEPTVLAPRRRSKPERPHWGAMSIAASAAAVAFVGWMALSGKPTESVQMAAVPATVIPHASAVVADGTKDYLLAHQRYSPSSAMQGVAPYVRTVAERRSSLRR